MDAGADNNNYNVGTGGNSEADDAPTKKVEEEEEERRRRRHSSTFTERRGGTPPSSSSLDATAGDPWHLVSPPSQPPGHTPPIPPHIIINISLHA